MTTRTKFALILVAGAVLGGTAGGLYVLGRASGWEAGYRVGAGQHADTRVQPK